MCVERRYGALADIEAAIQAKVKSLPPDSMLSAEVRYTSCHIAAGHFRTWWNL